MRGLGVLLTTLAGGMVLFGCGSGDSDRDVSTAGRSGFLGMNAQYLPAFARAGDHETVERHLSAIADLGMGFVRGNVNWGLVQAQPGETAIDLSPYDSWARELAEQGLRWEPTLIGIPTPVWAADPATLAACGSRSPPGNPAEFALFSAAVAERYGHDGSFWDEFPDIPERPITDYEIWIAPNYGYFWCPGPDPPAFAALLNAASEAIRAVDPAATVLIGGLGPFTDTSASTPRPSMGVSPFLGAALRSGLDPKAVGAVGVHLYSRSATENLHQLAWFRRVIDATALAEKPIVVTELGWPTSGAGGPPPLPEAERAEQLRIATEAILERPCGVIRYTPHTWWTPEVDTANAEHWYGIADPQDAEPYPGALAIRDALESHEQGDTAEPGEAICPP